MTDNKTETANPDSGDRDDEDLPVAPPPERLSDNGAKSLQQQRREVAERAADGASQETAVERNRQ